MDATKLLAIIGAVALSITVIICLLYKRRLHKRRTRQSITIKNPKVCHICGEIQYIDDESSQNCEICGNPGDGTIKKKNVTIEDTSTACCIEVSFNKREKTDNHELLKSINVFLAISEKSEERNENEPI